MTTTRTERSWRQQAKGEGEGEGEGETRARMWDVDVDRDKDCRRGRGRADPRDPKKKKAEMPIICGACFWFSFSIYCLLPTPYSQFYWLFALAFGVLHLHLHFAPPLCTCTAAHSAT